MASITTFGTRGIGCSKLGSSTISFLGNGAITSNAVSLDSSLFPSVSPTFTLFGDTNGGPPTTYTWTRDGQVITNNASYSISIQVRSDSTAFQESLYRSTLTVTGRLPGVYLYTVTNRATPSMMADQMNIEGTLGRYTHNNYMLVCFSITCNFQMVHFLLMSQLSRLV